MGRYGVVLLSTVQKYNRLDAGFYLGNDDERAKAVEQAKVNLKSAKTKLQQAKARRQAEQERVSQMCVAGEVFVQPFKRRKGKK